MISVITTLHEDGFNLYGENNFKSWIKYFPHDWNILYYAENHFPKLDPRIKILDFHESCPDWKLFYQRIKNQKEESNLDIKQINRLKKALRWSFKSYAIVHFLENPLSRYLLWLDSDVVCIKPPPKRVVEDSLKNCSIACQLENVQGKNHIETGAVLIDALHRDSVKIKDWIKQGYHEGKILNEDKPWDGMWLAKFLTGRDIEWSDIRLVSQRPNNLYWLNHRVGKEKFKNVLINNRSGRSTKNELL